MRRTNLSLFTFAVFTLLLTIAFAFPNSAFAFEENQLLVNPDRLDFGSVAVGTTSPAQSVAATNITDDDTISFLTIFCYPTLPQSRATPAIIRWPRAKPVRLMLPANRIGKGLSSGRWCSSIPPGILSDVGATIFHLRSM